MVQYTKDGREVFLTSENPDLPGIYVVKNPDGTTEPYTGKIEDLGVAVEIKSPVVFSGAVLYTSDKSEAVINKLKELADDESWSDTMDNESDCVVNDLAGGNIDDAFDGGFNAGKVALAREILGMLGLR